MPALVLFGRRWNISSDDLLLPATFLCFFHLFWSILLSISFFIDPLKSFCNELMQILIGLVAIFVLSATVELLVAVVSSRGTPMADLKRSCMPYLLYFKFGLSLIELLWEVVTMAFYLITTSSFQAFPFLLFTLYVLMAWLMALLCLIGIEKLPSLIGQESPHNDALLTHLYHVDYALLKVPATKSGGDDDDRINNNNNGLNNKNNNSLNIGNNNSALNNSKANLNSYDQKERKTEDLERVSLLNSNSSNNENNSNSINGDKGFGGFNDKEKAQLVEVQGECNNNKNNNKNNNNNNNECLDTTVGNIGCFDKSPMFTRSIEMKRHNLCCFKGSRKKHSYNDLVKLLAPLLTYHNATSSDLVAGLILTKQRQLAQQQAVITEPSNEVYEYLSGRSITRSTRFLSLKSSSVCYHKVIRIIKYCVAANGGYSGGGGTIGGCGSGCCDGDVCGNSCCVGVTHDKKSKPGRKKNINNNVPRRMSDSGSNNGDGSSNSNNNINNNNDMNNNNNDTNNNKNSKNKNVCDVGDDDDFMLRRFENLEREIVKLLRKDEVELVYCSGEIEGSDDTSFFILVDHHCKCVVVCVYRKLCIQEVVYRMLGRQSHILYPLNEGFTSQYFGLIAERLFQKLTQQNLLKQAFYINQSCADYELIITGQSLAGGVACVLSIMLKPLFHKLHCYVYSPPYSVLSPSLAKDTQHHITTVVHRKDIVPRLGAHQLHLLRQQLFQSLQNSTSSKFNLIYGRNFKCCKSSTNNLVPIDHVTNLTSNHKSLSLPGRIIHIIRCKPRINLSFNDYRKSSVFQAVWSRTEDFNIIPASKKLVSHHDGRMVLDAMQKVLTHISPAKPMRRRQSRSLISRILFRPSKQSTLTLSRSSSHYETTFNSRYTASEFSMEHPLDISCSSFDANNSCHVTNGNSCITNGNYHTSNSCFNGNGSSSCSNDHRVTWNDANHKNNFTNNKNNNNHHKVCFEPFKTTNYPVKPARTFKHNNTQQTESNADHHTNYNCHTADVENEDDYTNTSLRHLSQKNKKNNNKINNNNNHSNDHNNNNHNYNNQSYLPGVVESDNEALLKTEFYNENYQDLAFRRNVKQRKMKSHDIDDENNDNNNNNNNNNNNIDIYSQVIKKKLQPSLKRSIEHRSNNNNQDNNNNNNNNNNDTNNNKEEEVVVVRMRKNERGRRNNRQCAIYNDDFNSNGYNFKSNACNDSINGYSINNGKSTNNGCYISSNGNNNTSRRDNHHVNSVYSYNNSSAYQQISLASSKRIKSLHLPTDFVKRHPMMLESWSGAFAPLASPENLSESSSLASFGDSELSGIHGNSLKRLSSSLGYQKLACRLDPIKQSPIGQIRNVKQEGDGWKSIEGRKKEGRGECGGMIESDGNDLFDVKSENKMEEKNEDKKENKEEQNKYKKESFYDEITDLVKNEIQNNLKIHGDVKRRKDTKSNDKRSTFDNSRNYNNTNYNTCNKNESLYDFIIDPSISSKDSIKNFSPSVSPSNQKHSISQHLPLPPIPSSFYYVSNDYTSLKDTETKLQNGSLKNLQNGGFPMEGMGEGLYSQVLPRKQRNKDQLMEQKDSADEDKAQTSEYQAHTKVQNVGRKDPGRHDIYDEIHPNNTFQPAELNLLYHQPTTFVPSQNTDFDQQPTSSQPQSPHQPDQHTSHKKNFVYDLIDDVIDGDQSNQVLYDAVMGHYSMAGRGYPHGFPASK